MNSLIFIITNRYDSHADFIIKKFWERGIDFVRFNTDDYPILNEINFSADAKEQVSFKIYEKEFFLRDIKSVWYRRPLDYNIDEKVKNQEGRNFAKDECEAFIEGIWSLIESDKWISLRANIRQANHKVFQLKIAQSLGFDIPKTIVTNNPDEFLQFWKKYKGEVVFKAIGKNMVKDDTGRPRFAYTNKLNNSFLDKLEEIKLAPCLFQEYIAKKVELRITVVNDKIFACEIHSQKSEKTKIDWRHYDFDNVPHYPHELPDRISLKCVNLVKKLGLKFGAIDMIVTPNGEYKFIEINPNGQWVWIEMLTKLPISEALINLLTT